MKKSEQSKQASETPRRSKADALRALLLEHTGVIMLGGHNGIIRATLLRRTGDNIVGNGETVNDALRALYTSAEGKL